MFGDELAAHPHYPCPLCFRFRDGNFLELLAAEKDGSGFADAINTVWQKVEDDVLAVIEKAIASDYGWTNFRLPTGTFTFNGHGGSHKVNVHWQANP